MSGANFRYINGVIILLTHVVAIAILGTAESRFSDLKDQVGSILIITPVTLAYTIAFIKYVIADMGREDVGEPVKSRAAFILILVTCVFSASLLYIVYRYVYASAYAVNEFKMWLGAAETAFGGLVGLVFEAIFGVKIERQQAT